MKSFFLRILAFDRPFFEGECVSLRVPLADGSYGVQAHHINTVAAIVPGVMKYETPDGRGETVYVSDGLLKVEDNEVLVLATTAERPEEIDANRAARSAEAAREAILHKKSTQEYKNAQARLARAMGRLKVKDYRRDMSE